MKKGEDYTGITVVYLCHDGKGNLLLNKRGVNCRDEQGRWDCGGGAIEFGESVEECLLKEIKEEYGVEPISYEFIGFRDMHRQHNGRDTHWLALDFRVLVDRDKVINAEPHKLDEIAWFREDSMPSPLHSAFPGMLKKYKDIIWKM